MVLHHGHPQSELQVWQVTSRLSLCYEVIILKTTGCLSLRCGTCNIGPSVMCNGVIGASLLSVILSHPGSGFCPKSHKCTLTWCTIILTNWCKLHELSSWVRSSENWCATIIFSNMGSITAHTTSLIKVWIINQSICETMWPIDAETTYYGCIRQDEPISYGPHGDRSL